MAHPKKRKRPNAPAEFATNCPSHKKRKKHRSSYAPENPRVRHPVLSRYYPRVQTLREFVIAQLPSSSRIRRKKVSVVGVISKSHELPLSDVERSLGTLLDATFVGIPETTPEQEASRMNEWKQFSEKGDESYVTLSNGTTRFVEAQALIVEYVVKTIFDKEKSAKWPDHLLCDGFRRNGGLGLRVLRPNPCVELLQQSPWPQLLALLGEAGDRIMIDLLLNCAVFVPVEVGASNVCQISGRSLSNIPPYSSKVAPEKTSSARSPLELVFMRTRMFYAKPALNTRGQVKFGLRHIHVLNRSPIQQIREGQDSEVMARLARQNTIFTLRMMMYMFPRQFGLHNAFTSKIDPKETSQRLKDYTLREEEIFEKFGRLSDVGVHVKVPKRLRGHARDLVIKLQTLHQRCSYSRLLQHYCPGHLSTSKPNSQSEPDKYKRDGRNPKRKSKKGATQPSKTMQLAQKSPDLPVTELATSSAEVSSFCQAVFKKVIPRRFWGNSTVADHNEQQFFKQVNRFVCLRRHENMSLHELSQGVKIAEIEWLAPPKLLTNKASLTDAQKRWELFNEFLYFLFDSILIPLIRSNFYVTESNTDKYRLFFFRHDIWRSLVEPAMMTLKGKMLEEVSLAEATRILNSRQLGFSQIRLLPKGAQMRPITNLRKRVPIPGRPKELGPGINKILAPAHTVLQLEKMINPGKLGSTMFSVSDIYKRIKPFKSRMTVPPEGFYFAKVDVQSAFDTIPQAAIVGLLDSIPQQRQYEISKYLEVRGNARDSTLKPVKRWPSVAIPSDDTSSFLQRLNNQRDSKKRNTVFVDLYQKKYETSELLQLIASHIQQNLVKVGKKYYRQKQGIPQGSILSSTLCNYFYADLELHILPFLNSDDSLLLRLIDDFLLITTDKCKAARFVEVLHHGVPEYGVTVNPKKSLVNFDLNIDGQPVAKISDSERFPYCGTLIDTKTLDIARASNQDHEHVIYNSLTVEFGRTPGRTFQRKVLNAFKIQSHLMFFDTGLNSALTMLNNIHRAFIETATKMWAYARCLPAQKQPSPKMVIETIKRLVDTAYLLLVSKTRKLRYPDYGCDVKKCEVSWLAYNAFHRVLDRKQSRYRETLAWLEGESAKLSMLKDIRHARVQAVA